MYRYIDHYNLLCWLQCMSMWFQKLSCTHQRKYMLCYISTSRHVALNKPPADGELGVMCHRTVHRTTDAVPGELRLGLGVLDWMDTVSAIVQYSRAVRTDICAIHFGKGDSTSLVHLATFHTGGSITVTHCRVSQSVVVVKTRTGGCASTHTVLTVYCANRLEFGHIVGRLARERRRVDGCHCITVSAYLVRIEP